MAENQAIPKSLLNLVQQFIDRQQDYKKLILQLNEEKQIQAKNYLKKFQKIINESKQFINKLNIKQIEYKSIVQPQFLKPAETKHVINQTRYKYLVNDIQKFGLHIDIIFDKFKPILLDPSRDYYPKRMKIEFRFDNELLISDILKLSFEQSQKQERKIIQSQNLSFDLVTQKQNKKYKYSIELAKNQEKSVEIINNLISFLNQNHLNIQIWDQQHQFLFGQFKIPLNSLLIYSNAELKREQKFFVFSQFQNRFVGNIELQFRSHTFKLIEKITSSIKQKNTIKSKNPIELVGEQNKIEENEMELRILERIIKYKEEHGINMANNQYINKQHQKKKFEKIQKIKLQNKIKIKTKFLLEAHPHTTQYQCQIGKPKIIPVLFKNQNKYPTTFIIKILGINQDELKVVTNPEQWLIYCRLYNYEQPSTFQLLDKQQQKFYLLENESVTILLKYLNYKQQRKYNEFTYRIVQYEKNNLVRQNHIKVQNIKPHINHTFRYYQYQNIQKQIQIPYQFHHIHPNPFIFSPFQLFDITFQNKSKIIFNVQIKSNSSFYIFIYSDAYRTQLLKTYQICITAYIKFLIKNLIQGKIVQYKVEIPILQIDTFVKFWTSNPRICKLSNQDAFIKKNTKYILRLNLLNFDVNKEQKILIRCINSKSSKIQYQWFLNLITEPSKINRFYYVLSNSYLKKKYEFKLVNDKNVKTLFNLSSQNQAYLYFQHNQIILNANQSKFIQAIILPHLNQNIQIMVNISDREFTTFQNIRFTIIYNDLYKDSEDFIQT